MSDATATITANGLIKRFGDVKVLRGLSLRSEPGSLTCLVGPNGAGKTTVVRVLATLTVPDGGTATVDGLDVVRDAARVRQRIGLAGQYAAVDEYLTTRENLLLFARLLKLRRRARSRADELIEAFGLGPVADRPVSTHSGGMRRRVDLAAALLTAPPVLFVDEPTTGLDPRSRRALWDLIRERIREGSTVLLTTQYLEESDHLGDRIYVLDKGRAVADGTPAELKAAIGGLHVEVVVHDRTRLPEAAAALRGKFGREPDVDTEQHTLAVAANDRPGLLTDTLRLLDAADVAVTDVRLRTPTLDDVFFALTGRAHGTPQASADEQGRAPEPAGRAS